jgi:hypothetical protein
MVDNKFKLGINHLSNGGGICTFPSILSDLPRSSAA